VRQRIPAHKIFQNNELIMDFASFCKNDYVLPHILHTFQFSMNSYLTKSRNKRV